MEDTVAIPAELRERAGKGAARAARRAGLVPAVIYGDRKEPTPIGIEMRYMKRELKRAGFFTRIFEIEADGMLRGTHSGVDGLYTADPRTDADATKLDEVSYLEVLNRGLKAMDSTAISLCMDNKLPIVVFDLLGKGNIRSIVGGNAIGTLIH